MQDDALYPVTSPTLNDLIGQRLRQYIVANKLQAGDKLPTEENLAQRLGVSRTAIREALRSLEAVGLIEARQGYGRGVSEFSFKALLTNLSYGLAQKNSSILQVIEIRKALDGHFVEAAIPKLTADDIAELGALVERMKQKTEAGLPITDEDYRFHLLIYERVGNPLALELFEITWNVVRNAEDPDRAVREKPPGTAADHAALLEALKQGDAQRARNLAIASHWNAEQRFRASDAIADRQKEVVQPKA